MCATCGCSEGAVPRLAGGHSAGGGHSQAHDHDGSVPHVHAQPEGGTFLLEQDILTKNGRLAERTRAWFASRRIAAFNLISSPGSGKTTLLERTIERLRGHAAVSVI